MTISPSTTHPGGSRWSSMSCSSGKYRSSGFRSRLWMKRSEAPRKTIARKPSHLGSNIQPPPSGSASASLASIGGMPGAMGNFASLLFGTRDPPRDPPRGNEHHHAGDHEPGPDLLDAPVFVGHLDSRPGRRVDGCLVTLHAAKAEPCPDE